MFRSCNPRSRHQATVTTTTTNATTLPLLATFTLCALLAAACGSPAAPTEPAASGADDAMTAVSTLPAPTEAPAGETTVPSAPTEDESGDGSDDDQGSVPDEGTSSDGATVAAEDIVVTLPEGIADGIALRMAPAEGVDPATGAPTGEGPSWDVAPAHAVGDFEGYVVTEARHTPRLRVYNTAAYLQANPAIRQTLSALEALLAAPEAPSITGTLPLLPPFNAAPLLQSRLEGLSFADGAGIRYLSMYGQAQMPLTNEELFYTFQGLSADGSRYVSLVVPVRTDALPDQIDLAAWTFPADYEVYTADTTEVLGDLAPSDFTPDLDALDALVAGLGVMGGE